MAKKKAILPVVKDQGPSKPLVLDSLASRKSIVSQGDYEATSKLLAEVKASQRKVKAEKDRVLAPLLEATKAERSRWSPIENQLDAAERALKSELLDWVNAQEAKRLAVAQDKRITKSETLVAKTEALAQPVAAEVSVRKIQQLNIYDEGLLPREFLIANSTKIRAALLSGQEVPGARLDIVNSLAAY